MSEPINAHDILDKTLPPELQGVITHATADQHDPPEQVENTMPESTPAPTIDAAAILATASEQAKALIAQKENEKAVASKIAGLETDKANLTAAHDKVEADLKAATARNGELEGEIETLKTTASEQAKGWESEKAELTAKVEKAEAALAESNRKLADITAEKVIATRTETLKGLGEKVATEDRIARVVARDEKGEFVMAEAAFEAYVEDIKSIIPVQASEGGEPAGGEVPTPGDTTKTEATEDGQGDELPAPPDLEAARSVAHVQATASIANSHTPANPNGVKAYANAFGA